MIRVSRGPEPTELSEVRRERLAGVEEQLAAGAATTELDLSGYAFCRESLYQTQHGKCCYCEMWTEPGFHDVEHFRPKSAYYWLTWTWENLFFACNICNRSYKRTQFPLERGRPLRPGQQPPGAERPALLDPGLEDPAEHIIFRPALGRWPPLPRRGSRRGAETIRILGLDRSTLLDLYTKHVEMLSGRLEGLQETFATQDPASIRREWLRLLQGPARRSAPFAALTRDVLDYHFGPVIRGRWSLELPAP